MIAAKLQLILIGFQTREELEKFSDSLKALLQQYDIAAVGGIEGADLTGGPDKPSKEDGSLFGKINQNKN